MKTSFAHTSACELSRSNTKTLRENLLLEYMKTYSQCNDYPHTPKSQQIVEFSNGTLFIQ